MGPFSAAAQPQMPASPQPPQGASPPQGANPQMMQMLKQAAGMGRNGDTLLAHLTPGEKTVPPEVQTPKVLATLNKAYKDKGVSPEQFTAGSPQSSINPMTGLPEYNFLSNFLPMALGLMGSAIAPGVGTALGSSLGAAATGAIGGGLGTTIGGLMAGQKPLQAGLSGLGAGAGGYMLGNLSNGMTAMGNMPEAAQSTVQQANPIGSTLSPGAALNTSDMSKMAGMFADNTPFNPVQAPVGLKPWAGSDMNVMGMNFNPYQMAGAAGGAMLGGYLGAPAPKATSARPKGFDDKMGPTPPWDQALGQTTYNGPTANFNGYDPRTNYSAAWRFF